MRKLIISIQVFVFVWTNLVYAADGQQTHATPISVPLVETIQTQMPKDYMLPDMELLDSVSFYNHYKNKIGQRLDVKSRSGRFGATFGDEFKQKIFEIERMSGEKIKIILTLTSTMADARILKDRMALDGKKMVIVEIPDKIQERILQKAEAQAAGGLKELWWDTKSKSAVLLHPKKTISDAKKIFKNQFIKPSKNDVRLTTVYIGSTVATTIATVLSIGVDPTLAVTMAAARIAIGGATTYYRDTIENLFTSDLLDETKTISTGRQIFTRLLVLGLGISEAYYTIGSEFTAQGYRMTQNQLLSNNATSGVIDSASGIQKRRLSAEANYKMTLYTIMIGSVISTLASVGSMGPMMLDYGIFEITALQTGSMVIFGGMLLSYKFLARHVEKVAERDLSAILKQKYLRLAHLRDARQERIIKEQEARVSNRRALEEALYSIRVRKNLIAPACSYLFQ